MAHPDSKAITGKLSAQAVGFLDLASFDSVASTNEEVKKAIRAHAPEGTAVIALRQSGGYGRQGRFWSSLPGGIYVSLLLRPLDKGRTVREVPTLGLVLSLAVRKVLLSLGCRVPVQVKWPNDVICAQGKLCGISLEMVGEALCVGIGFNLFRPISEETLDGKYSPAYATNVIQRNNLPETVCSDSMTREQIAFFEDTVAALLSEVVCLYNRWLVGGFPAFRDEYRACSALQGQPVRLVSQTNEMLYEGVVQDVDSEGRLCLLDASGKIVRAHSGEAHLI